MHLRPLFFFGSVRPRPAFLPVLALGVAIVLASDLALGAPPPANGDEALRQRLLRETTPRSDIDYDLQAAAKRDAQIAQLQKIIPRVEGEPRAELLFRLAELWWEKGKIEARAAILRYDEAMAAWLGGGEAKGEPEPRLATFLKESELFRHEALRTYRDILDDHPGYARRDEVLFADAYNKAELGRREEAIAGYVELLRAFPGSRFAGDAQVQLGEHYFESNQLQKAREAYGQALDSPNASLRNFARYKLAWCDYNAGDDEAAISKLKEVVADARGGRGTADQRREALGDLVLGFARLDAIDEAMRYFEAEASESEARHLIARLAGLLLDAGHPKSARRAYGWLIATAPDDPRGPEYQRAIVDAFESERERGRVQEELRRLALDYGPRSDWAKANAGDAAALARAYEITEAAMRALVTDYHQEAQRTKSVETYRLARDIYRDYLDHFGGSRMALEMRFFYAEILWALGEFEAAGPQYAAVATQADGGELARVAAYDAMLCFEKLVDIERGRAKRVAVREGQRVDEKRRKADLKRGDKAALLGRVSPGAGQGGEAEPLTDAERDLALSIDRFVQRFPNDQEAIAARYKAAFLFYERHHDVEAARRLGDIIEAGPTDAWSRKAVELSLGLLERRAAWRELHDLARKFRSNAALVGADEAFGARLQEISEASLYKHLDEVVLGRERKKAEAAQGFVDFAEAYPRSRYAPQALFYALLLRTELSELDVALDLGTALLARYPDAARADGSNLVAETWRRIAKLHERRADIGRAAEAVETYLDLALPPFHARVEALASTKASPADAPPAQGAEEAAAIGDALLDAVLYRDHLGSRDLANLDRALTHARRFLDLFAERAEAPDLALKIAALQIELSQMPAAIARLPMNRQRNIEPSDMRARALESLRTARETFEARLTPVQRFLAQASEHQLLSQSTEARWQALAPKRIAGLTAAFEGLTADERAGRDVLNAMAGARFTALEPEWRRFEKIDFTDLRRLKRALADKVQRLEALERDYLAVIALGSEAWTLAALTRLGQLYRDFAQKLLDSPDPPELSPEELDLYRSELENRAFPLEEKAIQAFEAAIAKAFELTIYDQWLLAAEDELNAIRPGTYPERHREMAVGIPPGPWRVVRWTSNAGGDLE